MFFVEKQQDLTADTREPAIIEVCGDYLFRVVHRTKKEAESAMASLVPDSADPWVYAGLRVRQTTLDYGQDLILESDGSYTDPAISLLS